MSIKIDNDFQTLIPPLSDDEYKQLEENCIREGIRDPLVVWNIPDGDDILLDGHNRMEIAAKHSGIPFEVKKMDFECRADAERWIILNQFGRRNLSKYDRSILALKLKPIIAERAKENERKGGGSGDSGRQKSDNPTTTSKELAKIAGVSHDTIHRVEVIEQKAPERLKQQVRSGEKSINEAYLSLVPKPKTARQEVQEAKERHKEFQEARADNQPLSFMDVRKDASDVAIIGRNYHTEILNAVKAVNRLTFFKTDTDVDSLVRTFGLKERTELSNDIGEAIRRLEFVRRAITESR